MKTTLLFSFNFYVQFLRLKVSRYTRMNTACTGWNYTCHQIYNQSQCLCIRKKHAIYYCITSFSLENANFGSYTTLVLMDYTLIISMDCYLQFTKQNYSLPRKELLKLSQYFYQCLVISGRYKLSCEYRIFFHLSFFK